MMDLECEDMCFVARIMYEEKFGEIPPSDISIESCSNKAGWPGLDEWTPSRHPVLLRSADERR